MLDENTWKTTTVGREGTGTGVMPKFGEVDTMIFFCYTNFIGNLLNFKAHTFYIYIEDENEIKQILSLVFFY